MIDTKTSSDTTLNWYALHTRSRHEKRVAERLGLQELETFLPVHRTKHHWKNGVHAEVELPLFPCYLFARASIQNRTRLVQQPGVLGFAASTSRPTIISDEEITVLRVAVENLKAEPHPYLNNGDAVRIVAGPLAGMEGILTRRKQEYRVVLSIDAIMRSIAVEVSEFEIEPKGEKR
ncbi:UpxY family transcription antiterminator [Tunturiibacter lichenicola]|jgi:transcription antitermination factor NusG|uniref:UpxY family transcription antiterminator n=1 Tax=Tunturiibacter lichenicola TaxID=2051959 RepID=UPI003D9AE60F